MKIALVAQHATPLRPQAGSGPDSDDIGLSELTRQLADHGHQVTIYAQKQQPDAPDRAELHDGVQVEHIDAGPVPATPAPGKQDDAGLLARVPAFSGPLRSCWERERPDVVHALLRANRSLDRQGGVLALVSPQPAVAKILRLTTADRLIPVFASVADAAAG